MPKNKKPLVSHVKENLFIYFCVSILALYLYFFLIFIPSIELINDQKSYTLSQFSAYAATMISPISILFIAATLINQRKEFDFIQKTHMERIELEYKKHKPILFCPNIEHHTNKNGYVIVDLIISNNGESIKNVSIGGHKKNQRQTLSRPNFIPSIPSNSRNSYPIIFNEKLVNEDLEDKIKQLTLNFEYTDLRGEEISSNAIIIIDHIISNKILFDVILEVPTFQELLHEHKKNY